MPVRLLLFAALWTSRPVNCDFYKFAWMNHLLSLLIPNPVLQPGGSRDSSGIGKLPRCTYSERWTDCECYRSRVGNNRQCSVGRSDNGNVWSHFLSPRLRVLADGCILCRYRWVHVGYWLCCGSCIDGNGKGGFLLVLAEGMYASVFNSKCLR